jgi:hypothetical protein
MKKPKNYINNKDLYEALVKHREKLQESIELQKQKPQVSNYIGEAIMLICSNLAKRGNFINYSFKYEMIADGTLDCIAAVDNFNPERTNNPFAYFTQIAWNAFLRRIEKEKKEIYTKHKNFQNSYLMGYTNNEASNEIIKSFEDKLSKKLTSVKKKSKITGIEKFSEKEEEVND